jgi:hypothetical protein
MQLPRIIPVRVVHDREECGSAVKEGVPVLLLWERSREKYTG